MKPRTAAELYVGRTSGTMGTYKRTALGFARLRRRALRGDAVSAANVAAEYRILKRPALAFRWWRIAVELYRDGDDLLEVAYCLQHGIGTRRDTKAAAEAYKRAIQEPNTTVGGREEARYHLATLLLGVRPRTRRRVLDLLREANVDDDYPQARALLGQLLTSSKDLTICHCRRWLKRSLGGSSRCKLHGR